jgi:hypothetical protein
MAGAARAALWGCALSACLIAAGCREEAGSLPDVRVEAQVAPQPPRVGPATVILTLTDRSGKALTGAAVELEGNMSHPGMKPVFGRASERAPGRYQAPLEFTMGGDWFLLITATLPDGRKVREQVEIPGVRAR